MKTRHINIILLTLACLASLSRTPSASAIAPEKTAILQSCVRLFGASVDAKQNLFEVNQAFVLQVTFSKRDKLKEFAVKPKYSFNETHPEWTEPDRFPTLAQSEFWELVARLESMKSKGIMITARNDFSVVTNSTGYYTEVYKYAVLKWGELADRSGIRFFSISYQKSKS